MAEHSMRTIVVANQKGGVGKTTTVVNLAAEMARNGQRVLVIDFDPQRSATSSIFGNIDFDATTYDLLFGQVSSDTIIQTSPNFDVDVIPSDIMLSSADLRLASTIGRERVLANCLAELELDYHVCLIDTPPTLGLLSVNALVVADEVLIPMCPEYFSLKGIRLLEDTMESVRRNLGSPVDLLGVLVTRNKKRVITESALKIIAEYFGDAIFTTTIPENIDVEEAHNAHLPLWKYNPACKAAIAYAELTMEIANARTREKRPRSKSGNHPN